jgi:PHD/YefM family antitoxin component YafN of YafNO toxin-antitoxin module
MKSTYSVTEAQANLPKIVSADRVVGISKHNVVQGFYIPRERFEALLETMELMANPKAMEQIRKHKAGKLKFRPLAEVEKELD